MAENPFTTDRDDSLESVKQAMASLIINPIDADKVAQNPGLLTFAHTSGSAVIKPEDKGKIKGKSLTAMRQQTENQMHQLYRQMQVLVEQSQAIQRRVEVSERIYDAEMGFEPIIGHTYYIYQRKNGMDLLSMVSPEEWGNSFPYQHYLAKVYLLADHTWEVEFHAAPADSAASPVVDGDDPAY